jgi:hypothetical protein
LKKAATRNNRRQIINDNFGAFFFRANFACRPYFPRCDVRKYTVKKIVPADAESKRLVIIDVGFEKG